MNENILLSVLMFHRMGTFLFVDLWITNNFISIIKKIGTGYLLYYLPSFAMKIKSVLTVFRGFN
jgi:hypothetical protein